MKKTILPILTIVFLFSCSSGDENEKSTSKKDTTNNDSVVVDEIDSSKIEKRNTKRLAQHTGSWIDSNLDNPVFYSEKVDKMISESKVKYEGEEGELMDYDIDYLSAKEIKSLNVRELIYYNLAYPASFSQVCAEGYYDDGTKGPMILGHLPFDYASEVMSEIQSNEILRRRDSVIIVLIDFIKNHSDRINDEYFNLLLMLEANEAIPVVIETASEKNLFNYTFLLLMMKYFEYENIQQLDFYSKLYGEESYEYGGVVPATPKNRQAIIKLAKEYYKANGV